MLSQTLESCHGMSVPRIFLSNALWECPPTCAMVKRLEEIHYEDNYDFFKCEDIHGVFMLTIYMVTTTKPSQRVPNLYIGVYLTIAQQ